VAVVGTSVDELGASVSLEAVVGVAVNELGAIVLLDDAVGCDVVAAVGATVKVLGASVSG